MTLTTTFIFILTFLQSQLPHSTAQTWIKAGYWFSGAEFPIADINSALFTHLICAFAGLNSSSYQLNISSSDNRQFSDFTNIVRQKNPSIVTLLSIGGGQAIGSEYSSMVSQASYRKCFIDSSIQNARLYGFDGLDFCWTSPSSDSDMINIGILLDEWRAAIESEARKSIKSQLILTMAVQYSPYFGTVNFPVESIRRNLNWVHVMAYDYYMPQSSNKTGAQAALYDPASNRNTDYGITAWINSGLSASKLVLGLPFYGYQWTLLNPQNNEIGAPARVLVTGGDGSMSYKDIKGYIETYKVVPIYNATYVVNYFSVGTNWIGYDDSEVVKTKVAYAKRKSMLGYFVWQVPYDDNWVLSQAAQEVEKDHQNKGRKLLLAILLPTAVVSLLLSCVIWRLLKVRENKSRSKLGTAKAAMESDKSPVFEVFSFDDIKMATDNFAFENKLGEGGYGPVYKGMLKEGQEIAVKRLSKTSKQGYEEFKNEVMLTAKLQHVNLVRVLGFCTEREEKMLVYEYMPNMSLDFYLYGI